MVPTILIPEVQIFVRSDISESDLQNHDFELIYEIYVNFRCGFSGTNHFGPRGSDLSQICHFGAINYLHTRGDSLNQVMVILNL